MPNLFSWIKRNIGQQALSRTKGKRVEPKAARSHHLRFLQLIGLVLLLGGIVVLIICGILDAVREGLHLGSLAAVGFFMIMIGVALTFPDMLEGSSGGTSSMRVNAFMIVSVFVVLVVKMSWQGHDLAGFTLDSTWAYVLAIALGSKAVQYFGEKLKPEVKEVIVSGKEVSVPVRSRRLDALVSSPYTASVLVPTTPPVNITEAI